VAGKESQGTETCLFLVTAQQARSDSIALDRIVAHVFGKLIELPHCLTKQESGEIG
jgi:hypothetical protein